MPGTLWLSWAPHCCRVTNQARAAVAAAAAASKYSHPEQPLQQQQLSYSKPSSLDVLSESAASQVSHLLGLCVWVVCVCRILGHPQPVLLQVLSIPGRWLLGKCASVLLVFPLNVSYWYTSPLVSLKSRAPVLKAESEESLDLKGSRATSRSAEGALPEAQRRSAHKSARTPASGGARGIKRSGAAALQSPEGMHTSYPDPGLVRSVPSMRRSALLTYSRGGRSTLALLCMQSLLEDHPEFRGRCLGPTSSMLDCVHWCMLF